MKKDLELFRILKSTIKRDFYHEKTTYALIHSCQQRLSKGKYKHNATNCNRYFSKKKRCITFRMHLSTLGNFP